MKIFLTFVLSMLLIVHEVFAATGQKSVDTNIQTTSYTVEQINASKHEEFMQMKNEVMELVLDNAIEESKMGVEKVEESDQQTKVLDLLSALQASDDNLFHYNLIFDGSLTQESAPHQDIIILFGIVGDPNYDQAVFLNALEKAGTLYQIIQTDIVVRNNINLLFGSTFDEASPLTIGDRDKLFAITGDPNYNREDFLNVLSKAGSLYSAIQSNVNIRDDVNTMFGSTFEQLGAPSISDRDALFAIVGDPKYNQVDFLDILPKASFLYRKINLNFAVRNNVNRVFGVNFDGLSMLTPNDRQLLFSIAGAPGYNQSSFLRALNNASSLYSAIQNSAKFRRNVNQLFRTTITSSGSPTSFDRSKLFAIVGDSNYRIGKFRKAVAKTAKLHRVLLRDKSFRRDLLRFRRINIRANGRLSTQQLTKLFAVTGDKKYRNPAALRRELRRLR